MVRTWSGLRGQVSRPSDPKRKIQQSVTNWLMSQQRRTNNEVIVIIFPYSRGLCTTRFAVQWRDGCFCLCYFCLTNVVLNVMCAQFRK